MEGSELTSKFEGRTPVANIEYFDNKMKTERVAVQARAATGAEIQPASLIRAGHGIPVDLGAAGSDPQNTEQSQPRLSPVHQHTDAARTGEAMIPAFETLADSTLISRAVDGQAECFAALLDRYSAALRKRISCMV